MFFKQLTTKEASLSYFFGCAGQGKTVAVDVVAGDEGGGGGGGAGGRRGGAAAGGGVAGPGGPGAGGAGGGVCGAGLSGKPSSTLGFEKRWNPALALDKAAFVDALTRDIPPRPAEMDAMVRANLGLAA
ncbi:MAG: hypothetical protein IPN63_13625 [Gammaproteobacteria bacterium]|nr:hypothetical protein [Gammaproteobacteria bacterium]